MEAPLLHSHMLVRLHNYVLAFAGCSDRTRNDNYFIWSYNLYTEQWRKYSIPVSKSAHNVSIGASAVVIGTDVYLFGDNFSNDIWQLTINKNSYFTWTKITKSAKSMTPSAR